MHNYGDIVFDLLQAGADTKIKNQLNKTPEEVAEAADHGEIVELLQKKGEAEKKKTKLTAIDRNIVYEQRQMTKKLEDLLSQQEKQIDNIKQLKNKVTIQTQTIESIKSQQISLQSKVNEIFEFSRQIEARIENILPRNSSMRFYNITRIPST